MVRIRLLVPERKCISIHNNYNTNILWIVPIYYFINLHFIHSVNAATMLSVRDIFFLSSAKCIVQYV